MIKDHKDLDEEGNYPTRLVVPATNFTAAFPNVGYRGIRKIFDSNNINYMRKTIMQASHLKGELEELDINKDDYAIMSLDIDSLESDYWPQDTRTRAFAIRVKNIILSVVYQCYKLKSVHYRFQVKNIIL